MADEEEQNIQEKFNKLVVGNKAEILQTTPTRMELLIMNTELLEYIKILKVIILGGETFPLSLYKKLRELTNARIFNVYGPTETTVWSTMTEVDSEFVTIGKPIANTQVYILDKYLKPVPVGILGEIYIGGDGVASGYYNRPTVTSERFIKNAFTEQGNMYKTGDIGYFCDNGDIVHLGRNDFQVKIHGMRIELGEIENVLNEHKTIRQAVVSANVDKRGNQYLCAYYVADSELSLGSIRSFQKESLPEYMIPTYYIKLDSLQLTSNGKVDRKALPTPSFNDVSKKEYVAPRNEMEKKLVDILRSIFEVENISINDNIFEDLGGDSLSVIVLQTIAEKHGLYIKVQDIYQHPTIEELSNNYNKDKESNCDFPERFAYSINNCIRFEKKGLRGIKNILLTGSTGFLGAHLLYNILNKSDASIYCLIRSQDEKLALDRLRSGITFYFGPEFYEHYKKRIFVITGDISKKLFGLDESVYNSLGNKLNAVFHSAALIKHIGNFDEFKGININGTQNIINLCSEFNLEMHYIPAISVSGREFI